MKYLSFIKLLVVSCILMVTCTCTTVQANNATFNVSSLPKHTDLATALNAKFGNLRYKDTAIIHFDKPGTYTIDGVVLLKCNVVMTGLGADKTVLVLSKDNRKPLKGADAFLAFIGKLGQPITVSISDLGIKLKEHDGIWWEKSRFHAVKIYHASKVDIKRVNSYMSNAVITNYDMRVCSNVTVEDCIISNYNNCKAGGNLWLRGEMHNISIRNNKFYKYGNDEALAFFSKTIDANKDVRGDIRRTNIKVIDNEFYYEHNDKFIDGLFNDMYFSVLTSETDSNYCCDMRGFELARNKFVANDLCKRFINFQFQPIDKHSDFSVHDNEFISNNVNSRERFYRMDIDVWDCTKQQDTIVVSNNTMTNNYPLMNPYSGTGYTFLLIRGGNVLLEGNKVNNRITASPDGKEYGINLLWSGKEGGAATLRNNVCKGLARIITLESGGGIGHFSLKATNNYFQGRTTVYCKKIDRLDLDFRNNTFDCNHNSFFLEEFASNGTLIFNNNKVTVSTGNGRLMNHYGASNTTNSMRFENLEVKGNEFRGVKSQDDMMKHMTNVRKQKVNSNSFRKY